MTDENPQAGQGKMLPKREQDLFKSVIKNYETKQYKKGIKAAENVLKRYPRHGETLCMKGLILNCTGKKDEAVSLVKLGLMNDMRSHVCWHVYGILHRSNRDYNEAIKAYKQALRIEPENLQILRDLSLLQIQMRDLNGFVVTRHTILNLKPNQKINWLSFALAKHLTGDLRGAVSVIDIYLGTLEMNSPELARGYETSELAMYRNSVLAEIPDNTQEALDHLEQRKDIVVDQTSWLNAKATYQMDLGMYSEAEETYLAIMQRGMTEDYRAHCGLMCALLRIDNKTCKQAMALKATETLATLKPITAEQKQTLLTFYRENLLPRFPRSAAIKRIPLTMLQGDDLKDALDVYCRKHLTKGVPSLGPDLRSIFLIEKDGFYVHVDDPVDVKTHPLLKMIVTLVDGYIISLSSKSMFPGDVEEQPPSTTLWTWYLRTYLHEICGEYKAGLELTEKALQHTPTAVDLYEIKARLLKLGGNVSAAADCLDKGRELDKQDRYINNQTTKYMLQANRDDEALERISLFTRHEGNPEQNLFDMQCSWYELELAACLARKGDLGRSLKKYMAVERHFEDFHEDQFDFHTYCIRKVTMRAYTDVLRWEEELWGHEFYGVAAEGIIQNYIQIFDKPPKEENGDVPDYSKMTPAERKKAKAIARKKKKAAEKKANQAEEQNVSKVVSASNPKKAGKVVASVEKDPNGEELLKLDPLEEAKKYVATLVKNAPNRFSTWILQYDVSVRRGKMLMALQALFKAQSFDAASSELFSRIVDFAQRPMPVEDGKDAVKNVLLSEKKTLLNGKTINDVVSQAAVNTKTDPLTCLTMRIEVAKALVSLKLGSVADACSIITDEGMNGRGATIENCKKAVQCLDQFGDAAVESKKKWLLSVKDKFPLAVDIV
mmetsp:Transcript_25596/g.24508  ORF Transcript_25596/g.24508 Transcript_25596/m.24508 type:complete len:891 (-) Transcript_25596:61-2733(-)|eukprot:CAMPEP_0197830730 /NCGR_PEP_ID=MMETSP1437-20131217/7349_1 /TAXON_ID=49252 ORGANISM="Eucampia antarctica, Strain CCMP1452" /NCGR_SAMPLE_ID=MMETSP1437 /ASSEMBLY_ACC=CAM_ASM_001096 /LENGTH=890 /DNA_ID=CAMNT_0043433309 /DNA_START=144 /DNA_END=2816 /DNA_ORIENTATION=+